MPACEAPRMALNGGQRAVSSVGRASRLHREGRRFEPVTAHHASQRPPEGPASGRQHTERVDLAVPGDADSAFHRHGELRRVDLGAVRPDSPEVEPPERAARFELGHQHRQLLAHQRRQFLAQQLERSGAALLLLESGGGASIRCMDAACRSRGALRPPRPGAGPPPRLALQQRSDALQAQAEPLQGEDLVQPGDLVGLVERQPFGARRGWISPCSSLSRKARFGSPIRAAHSLASSQVSSLPRMLILHLLIQPQAMTQGAAQAAGQRKRPPAMPAASIIVRASLSARPDRLRPRPR